MVSLKTNKQTKRLGHLKCIVHKPSNLLGNSRPTEEDKRESMEAERREKKLRSEDLTGMGREGSGRKTSRVRRGKIFRNF